MGDDMHVREAVKDDAVHILVLENTLSKRGNNCLCDTIFNERVRDDACDVFVAVDSDDKIWGTATVHYLYKLNGEVTGQIEDVVVDPGVRGFGVGKLLIDKCCEVARDTAYKCILNCSEDNIKFYEKCGFTRNEVQMRKELDMFPNLPDKTVKPIGFGKIKTADRFELGTKEVSFWPNFLFGVAASWAVLWTVLASFVIFCPLWQEWRHPEPPRPRVTVMPPQVYIIPVPSSTVNRGNEAPKPPRKAPPIILP